MMNLETEIATIQEIRRLSLERFRQERWQRLAARHVDGDGCELGDRETFLAARAGAETFVERARWAYPRAVEAMGEVADAMGWPWVTPQRWTWLNFWRAEYLMGYATGKAHPAGGNQDSQVLTYTASVSIDLWAITVDDEGITAIGNVSNDPIAEAGGRSIERDGVRLEVQSSRNSFLRAYDADTGDELPQQRLSYTNSGSIEVLAGDGSVRATFTGEEQQQLYGFQDGGRLTKVLLHSDDGMRWSRENLADLTGSTEAGPGFIQQHDGKVLITLVDPAQRTDAMATTMVLVGTRK